MPLKYDLVIHIGDLYYTVKNYAYFPYKYSPANIAQQITMCNIKIPLLTIFIKIANTLEKLISTIVPLDYFQKC